MASIGSRARWNQRPETSSSDRPSVAVRSLELSAFQLLREVGADSMSGKTLRGMALLGASLDYVAVCQQSAS